MHAILCRNWKSGRIKGRDLYDLVWYLSHKIPLNRIHLEQRLKQTQHLKKQEELTSELLFSMFDNKFRSINYEQAKKDVMPFIKDQNELNLWSQDFFISITHEHLKIV